MRIELISIMVEDQAAALRFYTETLGFEKKTDFPAGEFRWLTVVSPEAPDGPELALEPNVFPAAVVFQKALFDAGIPWTSFAVDDARAEYERLGALGVVFKGEPADAGGVVVAVFEDTCGNLVQIYQVP